MKNIFYFISILIIVIICNACNDEWKKEQYKHLISFKAPINDNGVTKIYVRYKSDKKSTYQLPLIVSGSTSNDKNLVVHVAVDSDTLQNLNYEKFQSRKDYYYKELESKYFSFPETVDISRGQNSSVVNIDFTLNNIDLTDKLVLPLTIVDNPSYNYTANPRKNYKKALLRIMPFNDYSGKYSATNLKIYFKGYESSAPIVQSEIITYVVDNNSIFFYAGTMNENQTERRRYKISAEFDSMEKKVILSADDSNINLIVNKVPKFSIEEVMDATRPYLLHRYITINNIDYNYTDYTSIPNASISYRVMGSLIMERQINTQIPDEDQAVEW